MRGGATMLCLSNLPEAESSRLIHKEDVGPMFNAYNTKGYSL